MAGGGLSTDEFYPDARTSSCGVAAQDTTRNSERLTPGATDRLRQVALVQFSSFPPAALAGGAGPHAGYAAHGMRRTCCELGAHANPSNRAEEEPSIVPVVSHNSALFEPYIRPSAVQMMLQLPAGALRSLKPKAVASRRSWQRFVAIRIAHADALPMDPLLFPDALAVIDRHYNRWLHTAPADPICMPSATERTCAALCRLCGGTAGAAAFEYEFSRGPDRNRPRCIAR